MRSLTSFVSPLENFDVKMRYETVIRLYLGVIFEFRGSLPIAFGVMHHKTFFVENKGLLFLLLMNSLSLCSFYLFLVTLFFMQH